MARVKSHKLDDEKAYDARRRRCLTVCDRLVASQSCIRVLPNPRFRIIRTSYIDKLDRTVPELEVLYSGRVS